MAEPNEAEPNEAEPNATTGEAGPPPPGAGSTTRWRPPGGYTWITVGAIGLAVVVVVVPFAFSASDDEEPTESESGASEGPEEQPELPLSDAEDGGELRIVESGFSTVTNSNGNPMGTWGLVVENTSEDTAATQPVELDYLDSSGESLVDDEPKVNSDITAIPPGGRAGISDTVYLDRPGLDEVDIELGETEWWPLDAEGFELAELTASEVETLVQPDSGMPEEPPSGQSVDWEEDQMVVQFRVDSGYTRMLNNPGAFAIFRDGDGEIVGGSSPLDIESYTEFPPGWSIQRIDVGDPTPADLAPDQTEVYPSTR